MFQNKRQASAARGMLHSKDVDARSCVPT